jgi:hypothetical protein
MNWPPFYEFMQHGGDKMNPAKKEKKECCSLEKQNLMEMIRTCDFCSTNWEEHHHCLRQAARKTGQRSRACMID